MGKLTSVPRLTWRKAQVKSKGNGIKNIRFSDSIWPDNPGKVGKGTHNVSSLRLSRCREILGNKSAERLEIVELD